MIKHVFITGISSGIGKACVERAIEKGWVVSGCARRQEELDKLQERFGNNILCTRADVCNSDELSIAVKKSVDKFGAIGALIANAGRGVDGELLELDVKDLHAVFDTNVYGVHRSVLACQQYLTEKSSIVIVSSIAGYLSIPRMGAYCATKHALEAYVAALRMELKDCGTAVMSVCPGTVSTNFFEAAPKPGQVWDWRPGSNLSPAQVAKAIVRQIEQRGPHRLLIPWFARLAATAHRLMPSLGEYVMRRALRKMRAREKD